MGYAVNTIVPIERSKAEIENLLDKYGATRVMTMIDKLSNLNIVAFTIDNISYKISVPIPNQNDLQFFKTDTGRKRTSDVAYKEYQQEIKRRWRSLAMYIKAICVAAEDDIIKIQTMLMPFIILPNGITVAENIIPQLDNAQKTGQLNIKLLGDGI